MADEEKKELAKEEHEEHHEGCCACCGRCIIGFFKFLLVLLLLPIFIVLIVVAAVVYIVTLPLKCCSPCFLPCLVAITELVKKIAMIPYKLMRWVCGKKEEDHEHKKHEKGDGKDYGATDAEKGDG